MTQSSKNAAHHKRMRDKETKAYLLGFIISIALTIAAFAAVMSDLSWTAKIWIICLAALLQIITHLRNFLHIRIHDRESQEDLLLILFSSLLLAILAGGTIWILGDLDKRMHQDVPHHVPADEGGHDMHTQ